MSHEIAAPIIHNLTLTSSGTEYSLQLSLSCRGFSMQCETADDVRWSNLAGLVAAPTRPYATLKANTGMASIHADLTQQTAPLTLYFAGDTNGLVVQVLEYS